MLSLGTLRKTVRAMPWEALGWAGLGFSFLFLFLRLPYFMREGALAFLENVIHHLFVLSWLLLATAFTRTLPLRTVVAFWLIGLYPVMGLALLAGRPMAALFGLDGHFVPDFWVPLTEEALKAAPVLLYLGLAAWRGRWQPAPSDGLLLGFAVGAGFSIHEDAARGDTLASGWFSGLLLSLPLPVLEVRDAVFQEPRMILGHAGWTALVGLGLGIALLLRRSILGWAVALAAFGIVTLDHMVGNFLGGLFLETPPLLITLLDGLLLAGRLPVLLFLVGIIAALAFELWILHWAAARERLFPAIPLPVVIGSLSSGVTLDACRRLQAMRVYQRHRRAAQYAAWRWSRSTAPPDEVTDRMAGTLFALGLAAGLVPAWAANGAESGSVEGQELQREGAQQ